MAPKRTKTIRSDDQETDSMNEKLQDEDSFGQDDAKDDPDYEPEILHEQKKLKKKLTEGNKGASSTAHENELFELSKRIWGEGIDNCRTATTRWLSQLLMYLCCVEVLNVRPQWLIWMKDLVS